MSKIDVYQTITKHDTANRMHVLESTINLLHPDCRMHAEHAYLGDPRGACIKL